MKKYIYQAVACATIAASTASCTDNFLDTDIFNGKDTETAIQSVANVSAALNGTYNRFFNYRFAGNYSTTIGDIASDISYWNTGTNHWNSIYSLSYLDTDVYLGEIWEYGYKVVDHASRTIVGGEKLEGLTPDEQAELDVYLGEAYALRAYATLYLTQVFGHQIKVNGADFSSAPGVVVVTKPVGSEEMVSRSTVGECYAAVISDLKAALTHFERAGGDRGSLYFFNEAAVNGLLARVSLYMENYADAKSYASKALELAGITSLAYTPADYRALYTSNSSNTESMFALAITSNDNWSANSCGTLWTTYNYSPSQWFQGIVADTDVRRAVWSWAQESTPAMPIFGGGKFGVNSTGNPAFVTNYLINAPEMFLIQAEADVKTDKTADAAAELLVVAKRNQAIASVDDLPSDAAGLMAFIKEERARELFQEGHRLWDLRRWGETANFYASNAPTADFMITGNPSDILFPIPSDEVNAKRGVEQTPQWSAGIPR